MKTRMSYGISKMTLRCIIHTAHMKNLFGRNKLRRSETNDEHGHIMAPVLRFHMLIAHGMQI